MEPVRDADGNVLGWVSEPDPGEPDVDYFEADRLPRVRRRADILVQAASIMSPEFDLDDTWDACEAAGMTPGDIDSAGNVVLMLEKVEHRYPGL
jgi:hypothetical protein